MPTIVDPQYPLRQLSLASVKTYYESGRFLAGDCDNDRLFLECQHSNQARVDLLHDPFLLEFQHQTEIQVCHCISPFIKTHGYTHAYTYMYIYMYINTYIYEQEYFRYCVTAQNVLQ